MNKYFYKLDYKLLDSRTEDHIYRITVENQESFVAYTGQRTGALDNNWYLVRGPLRSVELVQDLVSRCSINCYPLIMRHFPNVEVPIHKDDPNARNCVLINPIYPKEDYVSTHFYRDYDVSTKEATVDFSDGFPALINTQELHNLYNSNTLRINLQFCFQESFEVVANLIQEDKLFVK